MYLPVQRDVTRCIRLAPGLGDSCFRIPPVLDRPTPPDSAACSRTRANSSGAVAKPATARDAAPATSGAYGPVQMQIGVIIK